LARQQRLNEAQIAELFDPPTEQRELVRHYTLSDIDLTAINRCRGDHNRLGYALMRCYLRHPGRAMRIDERPPTALLALLLNRSMFFRHQSTHTSPRNGTANATPSNARSNLGSVLSANML
jgi:hypothetical protein